MKKPHKFSKFLLAIVLILNLFTLSVGQALAMTAYESADQAVTPEAPGDVWSGGNATSVATVDQDYWITATSAIDGGYDSQVYKVNVEANDYRFPKFIVNWTGHGSEPTEKNVNLYFWNFNSSFWEKVASDHCSDDCSMEGSKTGKKYLDEEGNVWVWAKADSNPSPLSMDSVAYSDLVFTWNTNLPSDSQVVFDSIPHASWQEFIDNLHYQGGQSPLSGLIDVSGVLYGMASGGGSDGAGTIYKYDPSNVGNEFFAVHSFNFSTSLEGRDPRGNLINVGGVMYGLTSGGGTNGTGTIFKYDPSDIGNEYTKLHNFDSIPDGGFPYGSLVNVGGVLYGLTSNGGSNGEGTIFKYDSSDIGNEFSKLYDFNSVTDGSNPYGSLVNVGGVLYGLTSNGGSNIAGTIFKYDPSSVGTEFTNIYNFNSTPDGAYPQGSLINISGVLYGMAYGGGTNESGTIFKYDPSSVGTEFTNIYNFSSSTDGCNPYSSLLNVSGVLYGNTYGCGANGSGTIFKYDQSNIGHEFTNIHDFGIYPDGGNSRSSLVDIGGVLYGTTSGGGSDYTGTIFKYDTNDSSYLKLYSFNAMSNLLQTNSDLVTSHSINFGGSSSNTFYYMVRSTDGVNTVTSDLYGPLASSCPFIFTNNGDKYSFITEASSPAILSLGTKLNDWKANPFYKSTFYPNPEGLVKVGSDELSPITVNGEKYYDIKATFDLNEVNYFDNATLNVYDHSIGTDIYPDYRQNGSVHTISNTANAPYSVIDQDGNNVLSKVSTNDNNYWQSPLSTTPSYLQIKLLEGDTTPANLKMVIKKGKEGDFFNSMPGDKLQYKNQNGEFVDVPANYNPFFSTRPGAVKPSVIVSNMNGVETKVIDLSGLNIKDNTIRLVTTNDKTQWDIDWIAVDTNPDEMNAPIVLNPYSANLAYRGVSEKKLTNPSDPKMKIMEPMYEETTDAFVASPLTGNATKYGEVAPLLSSVDNKFVVLVQGDEISMKYEVPDQALGTKRDFIYSTWDYHKPYIYGLGDTIGPLPFNEMTQYPYHEEVESYPIDQEHNIYQAKYNTRAINFTGVPSDINPHSIHHSLNTDYISVTVSKGADPVSVGHSAPILGFESQQNTSNSNNPSSKECQANKILTQNLKVGAKDGEYNSYTNAVAKEVKILQAHMNRLGFNAGPIDGILGPLTDGAIKRMQKSLGTPQDGLVGPLTRALINNSCGIKA